MPKLISGYIRGQIASKLGPHVLDAVLTRITPGVRVPTAQNAGTNPTSVDYPCKGFVKSFDATQIDGTLVKSEDRVIAILGGTLPAGVVPGTNDKIAIEDPPGSGITATFRIVGGKDGRGVSTDPDGAVYRCHARK